MSDDARIFAFGVFVIGLTAFDGDPTVRYLVAYMMVFAVGVVFGRETARRGSP